MVRPIVALLVAASLTGDAAPLPPLSRAVAGLAVEHEVSVDDSLASLAARYGVDPATIAARNHLSRAARLDPGLRLHVPAVHIVPAADVPLVINVAQRMAFVISGGSVLSFPVAAGRPSWPTPTGAFTVLTKEEAPTWDVPASIQEEMRQQGKTPLVRVRPSPENPLGDYWIGLSLPGIGMHGTNAPASVYRLATHGCIRVHPDRIRELFDAVQIGTPGRIIYEPLLLALVEDRVFVEVHRDGYGRGAPSIAQLHDMAARDGLTDAIDWSLADRALQLREGIAVDVSRAAAR